ncbi:MAG TPA: HAMP domain-containing sensor histidine kinase [Nitrososphaeraceae archaeon]|nr:HAMP domain-containing sensor histidine kinase [Nitrososphaeraceae archaeon]
MPATNTPTFKSERTEVLYGFEKTTEAIMSFLNSAEISMNICADYTWPSVAMGVEIFKKGLYDLGSRNVQSRFVTDITKDNIEYCKELMQISELRHLDGIKGNFAISEKGYTASATLQEASLLQQVIYSNVRSILDQQQYVFETLWNKAIPAEQRLKEIEEGIEAEVFETITNHEVVSQILADLAKSVKKEALFFLPNDKAMVRIDKLGIVDYLIKASQKSDTTIVRLVCPLSNENTEVTNKIAENAPRIQILNGNNYTYGIYVVDNQKALRVELKIPSADTFSEAIGFAVYSNRPNTVSFFRSVFELLWNERMLNEQLKLHDKMQKEFINIASHEMKTPTQAILGTSGLLQYYPEKKDELIEIIRRNAKRLQTLTNDILDVTRIESQTLQLEKERFNIYELLSDVNKDYTERIKSDNKNIDLLYEQQNTNRPILVEADKGRLNQVLSNLLNNALKFTDEGQIVVEAYESDNKKEIIISIVDTGSGINKDIFTKLFSKFATKSSQGTGLGLFISKSIIEAHGGKIWAKNNKDRGSTFMFTLPITNWDSVRDESNQMHF